MPRKWPGQIAAQTISDTRPIDLSGEMAVGGAYSCGCARLDKAPSVSVFIANIK
mgnify:CR=1 FL=1